MKEQALSRSPRISARVSAHALAASMLVGASALGFAAQQDDQKSSVFVDQAPGDPVATRQIAVPQAEDQSSKVYFPEPITPQGAPPTRASTTQQLQLQRSGAQGDPVTQLTGAGEGTGALVQLSDGDSARVLAQLDPVERQVLLDAVEGTDICDNADNIPAIRELCERRIETRSAEFARDNSGASAEDNLLGGRFDSARLATLQAVLTRLAGSTARPDDLADQAIASVALGQQGVLSGTDATGANDPSSGLSPETQAVVNAIVQQLGGG